MTSIAGSPGATRDASGHKAAPSGSGGRKPEATYVGRPPWSRLMAKPSSGNSGLLPPADHEAVLRSAVAGLERVDHPVAGHVEQAPVRDHRVVGAVPGGEDQLAVGCPEAEG